MSSNSHKTLTSSSNRDVIVERPEHTLLTNVRGPENVLEVVELAGQEGPVDAAER
jgi:hypothetical protein